MRGPSRFSALLALVVVALLALAGTAPSSGAQQRTDTLLPGRGTSLATAPDQFVTDGDVRLRYREIGQGEPILLLHGLTRNLEDWFRIGDAFARRYRVIALDDRGHGESSKFSDPARYGNAMPEDVIHLLDHLGIRRAHLIGHSMGALIALDVAVRHPDRVASVAAIAPPAYADSATYAAHVAPYIEDLERGAGMTRFLMWLFPGMPDSTAAAGSADALTKISPATLVAVERSMGAMMIPARADEPRVPVLIAVGSKDPLLPLGRALAARWPDARFMEIAGADHGSVMASREVWGAVREQIGH